MKKKSIIIVGMLDSVHTANWIERLDFSNFDILVFPSRRYRRVHIKLRDLEKKYSDHIKVWRLVPSFEISSYLEAGLEIFLKIFSMRPRTFLLSSLLKKFEPKIVHALEMQSAGYLVSDINSQILSRHTIIVTNWGSDIYYFQNDEVHLERIKRVLKVANFYSAECKRDYVLAKKYGFTGVELPVIPNSASFDEFEISNLRNPTQRQKRVVVKCYGGNFGLPREVLTCVERFLLNFDDYTFHLYSVTDDIENHVSLLRKKYPDRLTYSTIRKPLNSWEMRQLFKESTIYLGLSISDGVSTSFLESIALGLFPIQTDTSCANEWVELGVKALIIEPNSESAYLALIRARTEVENPTYFEKNRNVAYKYLLKSEISKTAQNFYSRS